METGEAKDSTVSTQVNDGRSRWMKGDWSGMSVILVGQVSSENLAGQKCTGHLEALVCQFLDIHTKQQDDRLMMGWGHALSRQGEVFSVW